MQTIKSKNKFKNITEGSLPNKSRCQCRPQIKPPHQYYHAKIIKGNIDLVFLCSGGRPLAKPPSLTSPHLFIRHWLILYLSKKTTKSQTYEMINFCSLKLLNKHMPSKQDTAGHEIPSPTLLRESSTLLSPKTEIRDPNSQVLHRSD